MIKEIECTESVVWELMAEINRLKLENQGLKDNNELLHNMLKNQTELEMLKNNDDEDDEGGWSEEDTLFMTEVYANIEKDYKIS
jgi:hypothetical protein